MSKHTPGPWIALRERTAGTFFNSYAIMQRDEIIAHTTTDIGAKTEADARLIAAAPDLLAACEALVAGWEHNLTEPMALVRAAIAKARGEGKS